MRRHHGMHIAVYASKKAADKYLGPRDPAYVKEGMDISPSIRDSGRGYSR
jgi:hypothetical protein